MKTFNLTRFCTDLINLRGQYTQTNFSKMLDINRSTLSLLESGKQIPSLDILTKVCNLGSFKAEDYFDDVENDGLLYLMGTLDTSDCEKINIMMKHIKIKEKYAFISRKCVS